MYRVPAKRAHCTTLSGYVRVYRYIILNVYGINGIRKYEL